MSDWTTTGTLALGLVVALYVGRRALNNRSSCPLPPGPLGLPWVGNVIGVNPEGPWLTYGEWSKQYGDLLHLRLLGKHTIVIDTEKVARDLLEGRSSNYSSRPYLLLNELCGVDFSSMFLPYGDQWRLHRRFLHQTFRPDVVQRFLPHQHRKASQFLKQLLDAPEKLGDHVFEYATAVILNCIYDYDPASRKDELIEIARGTLDILLPILRPERGIFFGSLPWLLNLPSWFPGMSFKDQIPLARSYLKRFLEEPFNYTLKKMAGGGGAPSMIHDALGSMEEKGVTPDEPFMKELRDASAAALFAASESSNSFLMTFFLMMVVNPDVQDKAQAQIDAVVGKDRLPSLGDRPSLPYLDAILRETLRYKPYTPLSLPHIASEDDVYAGYHIPKNSVILTNLWSMSRDESRFPNAHAFVPERFLNDDGSLKPNDIEDLAFGYGRRGCPGRHFAEPSVWGIMAKVLSVFRILKPLDERGFEVPVEPKFSSTTLLRPLPFKCRIVPRNPGMDVKELEHLIAVSAP